MRNKSEQILKKISKVTYDELLSKLMYKLKRSPQEYRLMPGSSLNNLWEEICVQQQSDTWDGWTHVDHYVESLCFSLCEAIPEEKQLALSYFITDDEEQPVIYIDGIVDNLKANLYEVALNYSNSRIDSYIYNNT